MEAMVIVLGIVACAVIAVPLIAAFRRDMEAIRFDKEQQERERELAEEREATLARALQTVRDERDALAARLGLSVETDVAREKEPSARDLSDDELWGAFFAAKVDAGRAEQRWALSKDIAEKPRLRQEYDAALERLRNLAALVAERDL